VVLTDGTVSYCSLVVATGGRNDYFGNDEWAAHSPGLKSIGDATEIRRRVLYAFEAAEKESDPEARRAWLTFVIVGAGPTGVELAGTLGEIANDTLKKDFRSIRPEESSILLLDAAPRVLPSYPQELSKKAEQYLIRLSVRSRTGVKVTSIDSSGVDIQTQDQHQRIASRTVLWAAGVAASSFGQVLAQRTGCELDRKGRVIVAPDLTVPSHPEIFVIGDLASCQGSNGTTLPGVAPVAMQQGRYVARVIERRLRGRETEPFRYRDKGSLATIGRSLAVADIGPFRFGGILAWLTWLFVHLMYLVGYQNRLLVLIQWAFHYFTFNRMARLILPEKRPSAENDDSLGRTA
jgi:NADH dehydrogenase